MFFVRGFKQKKKSYKPLVNIVLRSSPLLSKIIHIDTFWTQIRILICGVVHGGD